MRGTWGKARARRTLWAPCDPLKVGNKSPRWKAPSLDQEGRRHLYQQGSGIWGQESQMNKSCYFSLIYFPSSSFFVLSVLHKSVVSLSKGIKASMSTSFEFSTPQWPIVTFINGQLRWFGVNNVILFHLPSPRYLPHENMLKQIPDIMSFQVYVI